MSTEFGTALGDTGESRSVGQETASAALDQMDTDTVDFCQVFASPAHEYESLLDGIRSVIGDDAVLIGCSSSGELTDQGVASGGVAIGLVSSDQMRFFASLATGLSDDVSSTIRSAARELPLNVEGYPHLTGINLHDGLVGVGEEIALETQRVMGQRVGIAGGSASDDLRMEATHVFCGDTVVEDGIVLTLIASKSPTAITLDHGHKPLSEPLEVTDSDGPVVNEIDGKPAFDVWRDAIADHAREHFDIDIASADDELIANLTTRYEFGIDQGNDQYKIRWPGLEVPDPSEGHLRFAVTMPEGTILRVTSSSEDEQIDCVRRAVADGLTEMDDTDVAGGFVYECACRSAILAERFPEAPAALGDELGEPFAGFQTYGELCVEQGKMSGYHNTTSVILLLPD